MSLRFTNPARDSQPESDEEEPAFTTGNDGVTTPAADDETVAPTRPTFTARSGEPAAGTVPQPTPARDDVAADDPMADDTLADDSMADDSMADDPMADGTLPDDVAAENTAAGNYTVVEDYAADESVTPAEPALAPDEAVPAATGAYQAPAAAAGSYEATGAYQASPAAAGTRPASASAGLDTPLLGDATELRGRWQHVQAGFVDDPQEAVGYAADLIEQTAQALVVALRQRQRELRVEWERGGSADGPDTATASVTPDTEHLRLVMQRYRGLFNELCRP
jgi:hypothetical protein